ncbi:DUF397 domain-containing protein [Frankia sp. AgKG'84/4]|uniref:DUF397 domain-containing protein n=1 Tax=Frankia sp. AgKG'84/4 TaxID=573490 RepID=UPI00200F107E|nr:DUF397 domain-containing protein [Frankia sp. AgKG'84/4]MCL9796851.1 DUF397 domain-containing protein [Frankia sp. AgKG'84/4]
MTRFAKPDPRDPAELAWRRSSYSNGAGGMCVEVAPLGAGIAVRDSKNPTGPVLAFTAGEWDAFLAGARDGEFDRERVRLH